MTALQRELKDLRELVDALCVKSAGCTPQQRARLNEANDLVFQRATEIHAESSEDYKKGYSAGYASAARAFSSGGEQ